MATFREKLFLAIALLAIGGFFIYWAYTYEQKLRDEGYKTKKIVSYVVGTLVLIVGIAGLGSVMFKRNNIAGTIFFSELFSSIVQIAF